MPSFARMMLPAAIACALGSIGCEKPDHEAIDKWSHTENGPAKLQKALTDEALPADLAAHAAANLVKRGDDPAVYAALGAMSQARRAQVVGKLAPRLWDIARVEAERDLPGAPQITAKDALVRVRGWADPAGRQAIDGYLIDWYCVASYEDRAKGGASLGPAVMRLVGPAAGPKLVSVANGVIAAPGQATTKNRVGDELLLGLAATASPDAVKWVLDVARLDRGDPTLPARAMSALYKAYVDPDGLFEVARPEALVPSLATLVDVAKDDTRDVRSANDAVALIRTVGAPACLAPLIGMIGAPHRNADFKVVAANNALKCGGANAILDTVRGLPDGGAYTEDQVAGIAHSISEAAPRDRAHAAALALLAERSTLARWLGVEALAAMKSADDAPAIAGLGRSRDRLVGYWGERGQGKADPTLGERAKQVSAMLTAK